MTDEAISKGERDELRRIVRGDFKALKMEVDVRRAELLADIERAVAQRYHAHEGALEDANLEIVQIVSEANARIVGALQKAAQSAEGYEVRWAPLTPPQVHWHRQQRDEIRRAMLADLDARIAQAASQMARQENDLLKDLSTGALSSDAARAFLGRIPKVAALVPDSRLAELEASLEDAPRVPYDTDTRGWRRSGFDGLRPIEAPDDDDEQDDEP